MYYIFWPISYSFTVISYNLVLGRYDPSSILHYPKNPLGNKTIVVIKLKDKAKLLCGGDKNCNIGQREGLSTIDIDDLTSLYKCGNIS